MLPVKLNQQPKHMTDKPLSTTLGSDIDPNSPESPLLSLIDKPMDDMTTDELREHVQQLRACAGSNATLQANIRGKKGKKTGTRAPAKSKALLDKYAL
jgi:hypothetical protein